MTGCWVLVGVVAAAAAESAAEEDPHARAVRLVAQMTLDEKMGFIQGNKDMNYGYTGVVPGVPRLGIPDLRMNDGPQGFRAAEPSTTQWPSGLTLAHSFDPTLFAQMGKGLGEEFYGKGANVQFGPGVNLARLPWGGRSFEYLSGEDPFLGYTLVQPIVKGIQSQGVIANAKHYIDNQNEGSPNGGDRHRSSAYIDERTQMEMYFPVYEGAVEAGVASVMCANNMVDGIYVCENNQTGNGLLKGHAGFKGWMCSDYDGTRSTIDAANHGLDIAMPGPPGRPDFFGAPLRQAIKDGRVAESVITDKAVRIVYSLAVVGALDQANPNNSTADVTSPEHYALARTLAAASATLLRNEREVLPLSKAKLAARNGSVALIGLAGRTDPLYGGGGSGHVVPKSPVSIYDALVDVLGHPGPVPPVTCTVVDRNTDYECGDGNSQRVKAANNTVEACCDACREGGAQWVAFTFKDTNDNGGCWCHPGKGCTKLTKNREAYNSGTCGGGIATGGPVAYDDGTNIDSSTAIAKAADVAIVVLSQTSSEGHDRDNITLGQSAIVSAIAAAQPNTIVITVSPGPFLTPWRDEVAAILDLGFPGEQEGPATADVLFGDVNPRGKMPHTLPITSNDQGFTTAQYPGVSPADMSKACNTTPVAPQPNGLNPEGGTGAPPCEPWALHYSETLFVGYRWYDEHGVKPAFPFGHGLSYTTFSYSDLSVSSSSATFTLKNNGSVAGTEVVQLYLKFPASAGEPPQQLKAFQPVQLDAGASTTVTLSLTQRSFSIWSVDVHAWTVVKGDFGVAVGSSSRDIRLHGSVTMA